MMRSIPPFINNRSAPLPYRTSNGDLLVLLINIHAKYAAFIDLPYKTLGNISWHLCRPPNTELYLVVSDW